MSARRRGQLCVVRVGVSPFSLERERKEAQAANTAAVKKPFYLERELKEAHAAKRGGQEASRYREIPKGKEALWG